MACRTGGRADVPLPDADSLILPQETRFGWHRDLDPVTPEPLESPSTAPLESTPAMHVDFYANEVPAPASVAAQPGSNARFGWRSEPLLGRSPGDSRTTTGSPRVPQQAPVTLPRPLASAPLPRFTPDSVTASLQPAPPAMRRHGSSESEVWWPEGSNRTINFVGPAVRSIPQGNFTRTAMVAATVAAVASSTVLGPAMAGAVVSSSAEATGQFSAVKVSGATGGAVAAPAATTSSAANSDGMGGGGQGINYVVKAGDTLHGIAEKYGVSTTAIIQANDLANPNLIFPGDHVNVPAGSSTQDITITVQAGDTINALATHYGVNSSAIVDLASNKITNPDLIIVGQKLIIPGVKSASAPSAQGGATSPVTTAPLATTSTQQPPKPAPKATPQATPKPAPQPTQAPQPAASNGFVWPVQGTITQNFGPTSFGLEPAYQGYAHFHQGLDIANSMYTPIKAADSGTVIFAGWSNVGYGFCVQIDHGNGLVTLYGHMAQQPSVSVGEKVAAGQLIGKMGSTGASTGSHLHFAVQKNGTWVNPLNYLP